MQRIRLVDLLGRTVVLEQDPECNETFHVGDTIRDLSCVFHPHGDLYTVVGFTRSFKGEMEFLWYTKPSFWILYGEVRIWPVIYYSLGKNGLPWMKITGKNLGSNSNEKEILNSLLGILKTQYSLY